MSVSIETRFFQAIHKKECSWLNTIPGYLGYLEIEVDRAAADNDETGCEKKENSRQNSYYKKQ